MTLIKLKDLPQSIKVFVSFLLCLLGLSYLTLLSSIWIDTEMKIPYIIEGYGSFEFIELAEHSFKYIFWFIGTFGITVSLFLLTSGSERVKRFFAMAVPLLIVSDIGSMWLIRYSPVFAYQLYASGVMLAVSFLVLFVLIQSELWFNKVAKKKRKMVSKIGGVSEDILRVLDEANEPVCVKEIEFHLDDSPEMIQMSLGWLVREGIVCAESKNNESYMVRSDSSAHNTEHCQGTHRWARK